MKKQAIIFLAAAVFVLLELISLSPKISSLFSLDFPIAVHKGFPVPVFFWLVVFLYSAFISYLLKIRLVNIIKKMLVFGFLQHLLIDLLMLKFQLSKGAARLLGSQAYVFYCDLFILSAFSLLALYSSKVFELNRNQNSGQSYSSNVYTSLFLMLLVYIASALFLNGFIFLPCFILLVFGLGIFRSLKKYPAQNTIFVRASSIKGWLLNEKVFLLLIFIFALALRIFYLYRIMSVPEYIDTGSDGRLYDSLAYAYMQGNNITEALVAGYWLFVSGVYAIFGRSYFAVCFIQGIFTSLACIFVYFISKILFNLKTARITAAMSALNFSAIFSSSAIGHQALDLFYSTLGVMLFAVYIYYQGNFKAKNLHLALTGLIWGLAIATREINFFYPFMVILGLMLFLSRKAGFKKTVVDCLLIVVFVLISLSPFALRNKVNLGTYYPVSSAEGTNYPIVESYLRGENPDLVKAGIDLSAPGSFLKLLYEKPSFVLRVLGNNYWMKFKAMYLNQGYGGIDPIFLYRLSNYYYSLWFYAYILTLIGIFAAFRRYGLFGTHLLILIFIAYRTGIHFITEASYRHRAPIEQFLLIYLAYGISVVWTAYKNSFKNEKN
ncbi:MAG: hypothetical protein C4533_04175 [Candidatus Omnitrophota bacterium]|jgi:4-amino-4-deoxy-L-arabinose transferase-like glycosyltransferase|nr:MAG: hypothetical protein C4533_04175 [Candidatus Omnitrophota bacterium]